MLDALLLKRVDCQCSKVTHTSRQLCTNIVIMRVKMQATLKIPNKVQRVFFGGFIIISREILTFTYIVPFFCCSSSVSLRENVVLENMLTAAEKQPLDSVQSRQLTSASLNEKPKVCAVWASVLFRRQTNKTKPNETQNRALSSRAGGEWHSDSVCAPVCWLHSRLLCLAFALEPMKSSPLARALHSSGCG